MIILLASLLVIPRLFGFLPMGVLSGSMEPTYRVGSVVYVNTRVKPEDIQVGDVITFYLDGNAIGTHRAIAIDSEKGQITTKGDANESADMAAVSFGSLIGRAGFSIPKMGYIALNIKSKEGIAIGSGIVAVLVILFAVPAILKSEDKPKAEARKDEEGNQNEEI